MADAWFRTPFIFLPITGDTFWGPWNIDQIQFQFIVETTVIFQNFMRLSMKTRIIKSSPRPGSQKASYRMSCNLSDIIGTILLQRCSMNILRNISIAVPELFHVKIEWLLLMHL